MKMKKLNDVLGSGEVVAHMSTAVGKGQDGDCEIAITVITDHGSVYQKFTGFCGWQGEWKEIN